MNKDSTAVGSSLGLDDWIDPLEQALRDGVNSYLRELLELEVTAALGRLRYGRQDGAKGHRNGHRTRELVSTMGRLKVDVPRAQVVAEGQVLARHACCFERYQTRNDWQHYIAAVQRKPGALRDGAPFAEMPAPLRSLQHHLLRRPGGDRVMAQVLAAIRACRFACEGQCVYFDRSPNDRGDGNVRTHPSCLCYFSLNSFSGERLRPDRPNSEERTHQDEHRSAVSGSAPARRACWRIAVRLQRTGIEATPDGTEE